MLPLERSEKDWIAVPRSHERPHIPELDPQSRLVERYAETTVFWAANANVTKRWSSTLEALEGLPLYETLRMLICHGQELTSPMSAFHPKSPSILCGRCVAG